MSLSRKSKAAIRMKKLRLKNASQNTSFQSTKSHPLAAKFRMAKYYENLSPTTKQLKLEKNRSHKFKLKIKQAGCTERVNPIEQSLSKEFTRDIYNFADNVCFVCKKLYFKKQVFVTSRENILCQPAHKYLPDLFTCCRRCFNTFKNRKVPSNSFWNNMSVPEIPSELKILTELEIRLLSRIIPFLKIIRLGGSFGQMGFKGQAVLFAQEVEEVAEQLPLSIDKIGLIVVSESKDTLSQCKEFTVSVNNVENAFNWLLNNNHLYNSVQINYDNLNLIIKSQLIQEVSFQKDNKINPKDGDDSENFKNIGENKLILRGNFHQGSINFNDNVRGKQCTAIATVAIVLAHVKQFCNWCSNDIDRALLLGSSFYEDCISVLSNHPDYLLISELKNSLKISNIPYNLNIFSDFVAGVTYCPVQTQLPEGFYPNLVCGLLHFLQNYNFGVLTLKCTSMSIAQQSSKFWLFDSHSRGPKGYMASNRGRALLLCFEDPETLSHHITKMMKCKKNDRVQYTISAIVVGSEENQPLLETSFAPNYNFDCSNQNDTTIIPPNENINEQSLIEITALMPLETPIPTVQDIVQRPDVGDFQPLPVYHLKRKTAPPVSALLEKKAEELAWFTLFPTGKNGLNEDREVPITALDYFQTRVMSCDRRFQRLDYLFYALSIMELLKATQTASVCGRLRVDGEQPTNLIDNLHIVMKNIRGTSSYWHGAYRNLMSMVRNLGPPSWYITLSCNDLHWDDILTALLRVDGQINRKPADLTFSEKKELVEKYPVTLSRQFMYRFNALMRILNNSQLILGGKVIDYWWRIEFQLRGSPHVHMVVWCEGLPDFESADGIKLIDNVISSASETGDEELNELINRVQIHKHTQTCFKNKDRTSCRFGFPRNIAEKTTILDPETAIRNGGRFCILKRSPTDKMINNYNKDILKLWKANMDIQPCGNAIGVAYYITKYVAKSEPALVAKQIRETLEKVKSFGGNFYRQVFSVSMAILNHRQVSACECAFRLCHLKLRDSTRTCVFVNTCLPEQRYRMVKLNTGDVFDNIFDKYENRPTHLENLSLAEFAVQYESAVKSKNYTDEEVDEFATQTETNIGNFITLSNRKGRMRLRSKLAILRTRNFSPKSDPDNYYYSLMVSHMPFRNENELLDGFESIKEAFFTKKNRLRPLNERMDVEQFSNFETEINDAINRIVGEKLAVEVRNNDPDQFELQNGIFENFENLNVCEDDLIQIQQNCMSDDCYENAVRSLNIQQKRLFGIICDKLLDDDSPPILFFITGGAGSGKTFILKLLVEQIRRLSTTFPGQSTVAIAAPTGVAAKLIGGNTLHSTFALPIDKSGSEELKSLSGERLERERSKWKTIKWVIIDEISMVSYTTLRMIHLRLQELKQNSSIYGGVNILFFGDLMQLPPVSKTSKSKYCFRQPSTFQGEPHLWQCLNFCELSTIMRQVGDTTFTDLLNNLRVGCLTMEQLQLLDDKRICSENVTEIIHIFPTTKQVDEFNKIMSQKLCKSKKMFTVNAIDKSIEAKTFGQIPDKKFISSDPNKTGGILSSIEIGVGSRIMLRRNINIQRGLVNGAMGSLCDIKWPALRRNQLEKGELPDSVIIKFDDLPDKIEIEPVITVFDGIKGFGKIGRKMLPIILCWGVTIHKLQGTTLNQAVVDLGPKLFAKGQAYVALSRLRSLDGLKILNLCPNRLLNKPHDQHSLKELERLRQLSPF